MGKMETEEFQPQSVQGSLSTPGNEKRLRWPQFPELQANWENGVKGELAFVNQQIEWFEDFLKRQWADYETCNSVRKTLEMQKKDRAILEEALKLGDYPNAAA